MNFTQYMQIDTENSNLVLSHKYDLQRNENMALHELAYDFDAAVKRQNISLKDIEVLRASVKDDAPENITDKQLALFLDACGGVKEATKVIQMYYKTRRGSPEYFSKRNPHSAEIQQCLDNQDYVLLPPTKDGYPIVFHRVSNSKPSNYHIDNAMKTFFMTIDACLYKLGPYPGIIFIFDMKFVSFGHLTRARINSVKKFFIYLQECLPGKLCQIHILNVVSFFDKILSIIKPFMKAEIFKSLYTYPSDLNMDEFHQKWVPKECLPKDFGGDLPTVEELHSSFRKEIVGMADYFIAEEEQRLVFENKKYNNNNTSNTIKISKLEID